MQRHLYAVPRPRAQRPAKVIQLRLEAAASQTLAELRILRAEAVDLHTIDGHDDAVGQRAHASRAQPVLREERPFPDHAARTQLTRAFRCLDDDLALDDDVQAGARLVALDQHLTGAEHEPRAHRLELAQIVLVHDAEYRTDRR